MPAIVNYTVPTGGALVRTSSYGTMFPTIFSRVWTTTWSCQVNFTSSLTTAYTSDTPMPNPSHTSLPELHRSEPRSELLTTTASRFACMVGNLRTEAIPSMPATTRYPEPALWQAFKSTASNGATIIGLSETYLLTGKSFSPVKPLQPKIT